MTATDTPPLAGHHHSRPFRAVSILLGFLLIAAAILKVHGDAYTPDASNHSQWLTWRPLVLAEAAVEIALAAALLAGIWPAVIRRFALAFFVIVFCVAGAEALRHQASCGCFGKVEVPPWVTALGDAAAITALWFTRPARSSASSARLLTAAAILTAGLSACIVIELTRPHFVYVGGINGVVPGQSLGAPGAMVALEPAQWVGKPFPLAAHIDLGSQFMHGRWIVLLVHHDCEHCLAAIEAYEAESANAAANPNAPRLAVVEMPPYSDPGQTLTHAPTLPATLDQSRDWFAPTPVALLLESGIVKDEADSDHISAPNSAWWANSTTSPAPPQSR